ncbi:MAG: hypothetical protein F4X14_21300 [Caldilineaceae bacterium SB0661_bin_32]|uniref:CSD domain-containing protein n=1 Tax=Caldilineaceae bacterium SB0661_bin_32 TaxID=2605255 RepID=A0A6B1DEL7_9CHLR|nr:hypothetical protein [Caldilineaceae bacterium SB0661_bin_32]
MNDLVLEGFVKNFAEARGLSHLQSDELFEAFVAAAIFRKYHQADITDIEDGALIGGSGDGGLDAVAILVNGRPARTEEDVKFFVENLRRLDVEFVFVQAKSSTSFRSADIGNFTYGVEQFFASVLSSEPRIGFNSQVQQLINLTRDIYDQGIHMQENPKCFLYYVTAGSWTEAPDPRGRLTDGENRLRNLDIFSEVNAMPVDADLLKAVYRELERGVVKEVEFNKTAVFPRIDEVDEAYIGLLRGDEFIRMISTDDGDLNRELFFDNVRDFQGHNPVNSEINHTLAASQLRRNFPLLNNGVTIVARELSRRGDIFRISDFQIVNGCQTTHILFQNKTKIDADTFIPVKLVATSDTQVITEVIKATNRQTAVHPEALESLTKFHKDLEDFYSIREADRDLPDRIHYERRSKQYARDNISPKNIVTLTAQIKSYIGMFLNEPHSHPRYYGELLRSYEGRIFANDHKPAPYYASGVALQTIENWLNSRQADREMRFYKYQLLMLLRAQISGPHVPKPNSNVISEYSLKIVDILRDPERRDKECRRAAELLRATLDKFGTRRGERNPPHRLRAFTEQLIKSISHGHPVQTDRKRQKSVTPRGSERGQIIWFDEWKNYGFIERDSGGDIFVHESQINSIPWHLRLPGKRVQYEVVSNPKSPTMLMASKVKLE